MRAHGVPNFPDPNADGSVSLPADIDPTAPAFESAHQSCVSLTPNGNAPPTPISATQQRSFLANAACMRKHGVPNFPDPAFGPGGMGIGYDVKPGAFSTAQSAILRASRLCIKVGSPLPLGDLVGH